MLKRLHRRHVVHYVGLTSPGEIEGPRRAAEYSTAAHPVAHLPSRRYSTRFFREFGAAAAARFPFSAYRHRSAHMRSLVERLIQREKFDRIICDFPYPAVNIDCIEDCVVFQHNVETMIWRRQVEHAANPVRRAFFQSQAAFTERFEREVCRKASAVVAVSREDAATMQRMFGIPRPAAIPTGVDADYFNPQPTEARWDLIFVGSMDWLANIDAATFFVEQVLPVIRRSLPSVTVALVGRRPAPAVRELARQHPGVTVTGTVADIRPYLWASKVSIVPLRIGGGTRLKIYEAMAAECPVVSTTIGAEGLDARSPDEIRIGDTPDELARHCVELLRSAAAREAQAQAAAALVRERFSWDRVAAAFEQAAGLTPSTA
ncbi:MAG: glycosyltransferase [Bryobacterales bacterium]